jgi:orotidine-5'-phosphate decarboxylase
VTQPEPRDRLIVALDFASTAEAGALVRQLGDACGFYKVGLELMLAGGLDFARGLCSGDCIV